MSSDYEGVITLWDTHTLQPVTEYEAHNKRVWSVDFCPSNAQLLVSGSDDGCVKVLFQILLMCKAGRGGGSKNREVQYYSAVPCVGQQ